MMSSSGKIVRIEDVLVGVFGAFIGGDFIPSMLADSGPTAAPQGAATSLIAGAAGAVVLLFILRAMRKSVGPLKNSKSRAVKRF